MKKRASEAKQSKVSEVLSEGYSAPQGDREGLVQEVVGVMGRRGLMLKQGVSERDL